VYDSGVIRKEADVLILILSSSLSSRSGPM
jgi:hypothetical protein